MSNKWQKLGSARLVFLTGFICFLLQHRKSQINRSFIHSFHWHVQNAMIPCRSQELLPFLSFMYFFSPPFSTNYSSILSHFILPSISWSTSQILLFPNSCIILFWNSIFFHSLYMPKPMQSI
jgi:hypothetical protein